MTKQVQILTLTYLCCMSEHKKYAIQYSIFLGTLSLALFVWNQFAPVRFTNSLSWALLAFFALAYALGHLYILGSSGQRPAIFVRRFMATTTIRLFLFLLVLVIYIFTNREEAVSFISHFLAMYLVFTIFEVASLSKHFRRKD
jgi:hypothetical protein